MAFADDFAAQLSQSGINVDPSSLPDSGTIQSSLQAASDWFGSLDANVRDGFDEGSAQEKVCSLLAGPDLNVAPSIPSLLGAFDNALGKKFSEKLQIAQDALTASLPQA